VPSCNPRNRDSPKAFGYHYECRKIPKTLVTKSIHESGKLRGGGYFLTFNQLLNRRPNWVISLFSPRRNLRDFSMVRIDWNSSLIRDS
jgi:hypothetical protein